METKLKVDKAGRMVPSKEVQEELHLEPGDGQLTIHPSRLRMHRGVWILSAAAPILASETDRVLEDIRQRSRGE